MKDNKGEINYKHALIYCRVSSERQKTDGSGLESQEQRCHEYARNRGYQIEEVFKDSFTGGGDFMLRPAMSALLEYIDEHPTRNYVVIFDDLKRLSRDTVFYLKLRKEFDSRSAKVESPNFKFEDTDEGYFIETIIAAQGELERKQNKRQVIQKQQARLESGYWPFFPPIGYTQVKQPGQGKVLVRKEPEASLIQEALEGFANDRFENQIDVRNFLEANNYLDGRPVYLEAVKRLLTKSIYAGIIEHEDRGVEARKGHHKALISIETYHAIRDKLNGKVKLRIRRDQRSDFPLRGFVVCRSCGEKMTSSWSKGRSGTFAYYRCKSKSDKCSFGGKSVGKEKIEDEFKKILRKVEALNEALDLVPVIAKDVYESKMLEIGSVQKRTQNEISTLKIEKSQIINRITKSRNEDVISAYEEQLLEINNKILALQYQTSPIGKNEIPFGTACDEVFRFLKNPIEPWETEVFDDQLLVLKLTFDDSLEYDREKGFGTAKLSIAIRVSEPVFASKGINVDMSCKSWNHLEQWVFEKYELLKGREKRELGVVYE